MCLNKLCFIVHSTLLYAATKIMIGSISISIRLHAITMKWKRPIYLPQGYYIHALITQGVCGDKNKTVSIHLQGERTSLTIWNLASVSKCTVKLVALYNYANNDAGISETLISPVTRKLIHN